MRPGLPWGALALQAWELQLPSMFDGCGLRDAAGNVVNPTGSWQSYDSATRQAYGSQSPARTVAGW